MSSALQSATVADLLRVQAAAPDRKFELLEGSISEVEAPLYEHGDAQSWLTTGLKPRFHRRGGRDDGTGGWWIASEVDIPLAANTVVRPDLAGWRRDRHATAPRGVWPVQQRPDWVCEVVSPGSIRRDQVTKRRLYWTAQVEWYWLVQVGAQFVDVLRYTPEGYVTAASALPIADARLPPFDAVALDLRPVFGIEEA